MKFLVQMFFFNCKSLFLIMKIQLSGSWKSTQPSTDVQSRSLILMY